MEKWFIFLIGGISPHEQLRFDPKDRQPVICQSTMR
jgi:hypothetical protein